MFYINLDVLMKFSNNQGFPVVSDVRLYGHNGRFIMWIGALLATSLLEPHWLMLFFSFPIDHIDQSIPA